MFLIAMTLRMTLHQYGSEFKYHFKWQIPLSNVFSHKKTPTRNSYTTDKVTAFKNSVKTQTLDITINVASTLVTKYSVLNPLQPIDVEVYCSKYMSHI